MSDSRRSTVRKLGLVTADVLLTSLATVVALWLRFAPEAIPEHCWRVYLAGAAPLALLRVGCFWRLRLYRITWRYVGLHDLVSVVKGVTVSSALFWVLLVVSCWLLVGIVPTNNQQPTTNNTPLYLLDWLLACTFLGGLRVSLRTATILRTGLKAQRGEWTRLLVVGAGDHAEALAREVGRNDALGYNLVGFLDDNPAKQGLLIHGEPVLGPIDQIGAVVRGRGIQEVIIAIPSASGGQIRRVLTLCEGLPVRLRITPGFSGLHKGGGWGSVVRDVAPEDLLRRPPVRIDLPSIARYLQGERVLITGAGGSIGSELVRQVLRFEPEQVLLFGRGENSLFELEQRLSPADRERAVLLVGDVRDRARLEEIFADYGPTVLFHAAAHKHVPLMELNPGEAIKNNVLGTRNVLELSALSALKQFVLISSDKAVNPSSVMGATKRIAEMLMRAQAERAPGSREVMSDEYWPSLITSREPGAGTRFMAVRFGNVLGSRGSVVQTMRRQIQNRRPVTVTHPEMVRFFMTIPEAAELVIQAGALGERGEIFVLDMGDPVRILDLAHDLIRLSGFVPGEEIPIEITGIRPGEKLYEEILTAREGTVATRYERIFIARTPGPDPVWLEHRVEELIAMADTGSGAELRRKIAEIVPEYQCPDVVDPDKALVSRR